MDLQQVYKVEVTEFNGFDRFVLKWPSFSLNCRLQRWQSLPYFFLCRKVFEECN